MSNRWDETWHRLREWTNGQAPSERLAAQILLEESYEGFDPSHPLGGKDGTKDAVCYKNHERWIMAVYFPRGQQEFKPIRKKFEEDLEGVSKNFAVGMAFVTNQELRLSEREELKTLAGSTKVDLFHLERTTTLLDRPSMAGVRKQFLSIDFSLDTVQEAVKAEVAILQKRLEALQTGGDTFCYWMLYHFKLEPEGDGLGILGEKWNIARQFVIIRKGEYPLYDVSFRIFDMDTSQEVHHHLGELNSPAAAIGVEWPLEPVVYKRVFFHARNGSWHQDLQLRRSVTANCWLAATRVFGKHGEIRFEHIDNGYVSEFGQPQWRP